MSNLQRPAHSHSKFHRQRSGQHSRQVVIEEIPQGPRDSQRVDRQAAILSTAMSRRFGQEKLAGTGSLSQPVDYSPNLAVTTDDR